MNLIFVLPSLNDWKITLDFDKSKSHSKAMQILFPLSLTEASTGLQKSIDFAPTDFVRPKQQTSLAKLFIITQELTTLGITDSSHRDFFEIGYYTVVTIYGMSNTSILTHQN